jgi:hypothetical protein
MPYPWSSEMKPSFRLTLLAAGLACCAIAAQARLQPPADGASATLVAQAGSDDGVISNPQYEQAGQIAANAWLLLLDRKDWGTAWDASSNLFRQNVPLSAWMDNVPKVREPFGRFVERDAGSPVYKKTLGNREGDYVTVQFHSKFENKADVVETVTTMREPDGRWRVTGFSAQ